MVTFFLLIVRAVFPLFLFLWDLIVGLPPVSFFSILVRFVLCPCFFSISESPRACD